MGFFEDLDRGMDSISELLPDEEQEEPEIASHDSVEDEIVPTAQQSKAHRMGRVLKLHQQALAEMIRATAQDMDLTKHKVGKLMAQADEILETL